jgi:hypothetical protein
MGNGLIVEHCGGFPQDEVDYYEPTSAMPTPQAGDGIQMGDTCDGDLHNQFTCGITDNKTCNDVWWVLTSPTSGPVAPSGKYLTEFGFYQRTVTCNPINHLDTCNGNDNMAAHTCTLGEQGGGPYAVDPDTNNYATLGTTPQLIDKPHCDDVDYPGMRWRHITCGG